MASHLVHLQGFLLRIGLGTRLSGPCLVLVGDSAEKGPPFSRGLADPCALSPPLIVGVIVPLAGVPAQGEEEEEGLVELRLFVCSTQAWARRGRRRCRYRAGGAQRAGAEAPGREEQRGLRAEAVPGLRDGVREVHGKGEKEAGPRQA